MHQTRILHHKAFTTVDLHFCRLRGNVNLLIQLAGEIDLR